MDDFERRLCAQTQLLYIIKMFYISQISPQYYFFYFKKVLQNFIKVHEFQNYFLTIFFSYNL